jgi:hypothetical protein
VDRIEIEITLNRDRSWLLEKLAAMSEEELRAPRTQSEHDESSTWSYGDHFIHTTLIERNWNEMFRRHLAGEQGMDRAIVGDTETGERPTMEQIMARVHSWTEEWKVKHEGTPFPELVRIGLAVRADTLGLLAELTDDQLASKIPGAPWADGTVGGIMAANASHGRMHWGWATDGPLAATS